MQVYLNQLIEKILEAVMKIPLTRHKSPIKPTEFYNYKF